MTSKPASRSARAMTFAPRSWPSSPGLAIKMRSGGDVSLISIGGLQQLDEYPKSRGRLQKRNVTVRTWAWLLVDHLNVFVAQVSQVGTDIGRAKAQVVQPWPAPFDEPRHRRIDVRRLEQLDQHVLRLDEHHFQLSLGHVNRVDDAET